MDKAQQIYKKYTSTATAIRFAAFFLYLALCAILNFIGGFPLVFPLAAVVFVIVRKLTLFKFRQHITGIILDSLDAPLYRDVIFSSGIGEQNILLRMESEFFVGNISGAIALGEAVYKNGALPKKTRTSALAFLAQYYYVLGDDEALTSVCRRFRESELLRRGKIFKNTEKVIRKYEYYLAGDYESFIKPIDEKQRGAFYPLVKSFNEARVALKKGDTATAGTIFSALAVSAENTVFDMIAKRAVDVIENGGEYKDAATIESEPIDVEEVIKKHLETLKKMKKTRRVWLIICAVILVIYLPNSISSWLREFDERRTCDLLETHYDGVEIVEIWRFKVNGKEAEKTVIAEVDGGIIIGGKYKNAEDKWEFMTYAYCPFDVLKANGSFGYAFNTHDNSALLYFKIYDHHLYYPDDDRLIHKTYHISIGLVTVVIDDDPIE